MEINFEQTNKDLNAIDALASHYGYQATIKDQNGNDIPNPQTKEQFAKKQIKKWVRELRKSFAVNTAADSARAQALSDFNNNNPEE